MSLLTRTTTVWVWEKAKNGAVCTILIYKGYTSQIPEVFKSAPEYTRMKRTSRFISLFSLSLPSPPPAPHQDECPSLGGGLYVFETPETPSPGSRVHDVSVIYGLLLGGYDVEI